MTKDPKTTKMDACCGGNGCGCADSAPISADSVSAAVQSHYATVAVNADQSTANPTGARTQIYTESDLAAVPDAAQLASAGCGNPVGLSDVKRGETVLDLGSGGGIDCFMAAEQTGPTGTVIGIDMTPDMVALAQKNAAKVGSTNTEFKLGKIEAIPTPDSTIDLVISNCVISLSQHKDLVWQEIYRVLKPNGRFIISDMVTESELPDTERKNLATWVACVGGADALPTMLARIKNAGFHEPKVITQRKVSDQELAGSNKATTILSVTIKATKP